MMYNIPTAFEWDEEKNKTNIAKHGVSFEEASQAFFDRNRVVAGEKGGRNMVEVKYSDAPPNIAKAIESSVPIEDFLPPPDKLGNKSTANSTLPDILLNPVIVENYLQRSC
ncbi:MAG: BrnT family toxin [Defluviitaleaceae bacterium]|nr:BrnT family toxin [Defluviitaleaceae bacterium]MCL2263835.1 BrnT family toxin [Defluviitaleaceae bacterium]